MHPPNGTAHRKPGAPLGNKNALKHGYYSHSFKSGENSRLEHGVTGEFKDEEALLRVLIDRTVTAMREQELPHEEWIIALRAVSLAIGRLESLHRSRRILYDKSTSLDDILDQLKYIPMEED